MDQPNDDTPISPQEPSETTLGRRELLKTLAAGSGAIAASTMVPDRWVKPVIEADLLPAHAQASPTPTPKPIVFNINCTANPTSGDTTFVDDITATVSALGGASVANIEVQYIAETVPPGQSTSPVTGFTDGAGVVNLGTFALCSSGLPDQGDYRIIVSFVDQATYGNDTCELGLYTSFGC